jgi:streptogramin lyase
MLLRRLVLGPIALFAVAQPAAADVREFTLPTQPAGPAGITVGPDGNLWVAAARSDRIARVTPGGAVTEFTLPAGREPTDITTSGGLIYFTEREGDRIGRLDPAAGNIQASISEFIVPGADSHPTAITPGPDGNVWFSQPDGDQIGRITPAGVVTETGGGDSPTGIVGGPDDGIWYTTAGDSQVLRSTTAMVLTNIFRPPGLPSVPSRFGNMTNGPDGALWYVDSGLDHVRRITTAGAHSQFAAPAGSGLDGIATGPDGALWLTGARSGRIFRVTTGGAVSQYSLPNVHSGPTDIVAGPDGALWFTERLSGRVGRITTNTTPDALPTGPRGPAGPAGSPGSAGPGGPAGQSRVVLVAFQVSPRRPRAGRRLRVRFVITGAAQTSLRVQRGRARARTVARKRVRRAGVTTIAWNGKIARKRARRGRYTLTVRATANGRTVNSRLRVRLR